MFSHKGKIVSFVSMMFAGLLSSQIALGDVSATKVGAKAGMVDIDNFGSAFSFGGYSEISLGDSLSIRPSVDYWQKTKSTDAGLATVEVKLSDLALGGALKYTFGLSGAKAKPYVLGGLAMHRLSAEVVASSELVASEYSAETSETEIGFDFGGGVAYPLADGMELSGELLMRNVNTADLMSITAGLAYKL